MYVTNEKSHRMLYSNLILLMAIGVMVFTVVATWGTQCAQAASGSCGVGDSEVFGAGLIGNEDGGDSDSRFEGDTNANLLFLNAGTDSLGIGTAAPHTVLGGGTINSATHHVVAIEAPASDSVALVLRTDGGAGAVPRIMMENSVSTDNKEIFDIIYTNLWQWQILDEDDLSVNQVLGGVWNTGQMIIGNDTATANANMTIGQTINQGGNDDEIVTLKSSTDVGHAMTALTEADTFLSVSKANASAGGALIQGFKDADAAGNSAVVIRGVLGEAAETDDTTASGAVVYIDAAITDGGTGKTGVAATGNAVAFGNNGVTHFLMKGDGDIHVTNTLLTALDQHDDIALIRDLRLCLSQGTDPGLNSRYANNGDPLDYTCAELVDLDLLAVDHEPRTKTIERVKLDRDGSPVMQDVTIHDAILDVDVTYSETVTEMIEIEVAPVPMFSLTNTSMLVMDALRTYAEANDQRLADLETRLAALEAK